MNWAAWTYLALSVLALFCAIVLDGKPRGPYSWRDATVGFCVAMTLLLFAGFFE